MARKTITIETPEWPDRPQTILRKWSAGDWIDFQTETESLASDDVRKRLAYPRLVAWSAVDADGKPAFARSEAGYTALLDEEASVIRRLALAAVDLHDVSETSAKAAEKN